MEWQHPESLYFILPLCVAWAVLAIWSDRKRAAARASFASTAMWPRIFPVESRTRFWLKLILRETAIVAGLVALAGPRFGVQYEQVIPRGSDLYVLIDVSRSMLADDVPPSRLGRAKSDVSSLVNRLNGERIGLIAFAGQAVVKCPLTVDYDSFRRALDELDSDSAPRGGTAIGDAIRKAVEVFHSKSERDQAILLITDGDDQQSYPMEAAEVAAERHVTIFTIGLGDADKGARIPQKANAKTFMEYQGEQVWSKLDSDLLRQIALKTSGVYIPAGTRSYDLGELYENHLQGRRNAEATGEQRIRRSERFQIFLAISFVALLFDLCIPLYRRDRIPSEDEPNEPFGGIVLGQRDRKRAAASVPVVILLAMQLFSGIGSAADAGGLVREGLKLYRSEKFEEAQGKFASAAEELEKQKSKDAAVAAFDEACSLHRKGDVEKARDLYLRAGLSQDATIAVASHFNLGNLSAEEAKKLCGEKPDLVAVDQREKVLDHLKQAVDAYRHCLELKPDHASARRNLELVRQWIKYYTDRWRELDRQKRRDESDLLKFLEYLMTTQTALRETVNHLADNTTADQFVEIKRAQSELREEIPTLREKIAEQLRPQADPNSKQPASVPKEVEEGIITLQGWADTAGQKMEAAERRLGIKDTTKAIAEQRLALDELERIWDAVVPFHPLLAVELAAQTGITKKLPIPAKTEDHSESENQNNELAKVDEQVPTSTTDKEPRSIDITEDDLPKIEELQIRVLKRARLLGPKAEDELKRLEEAPPQQTPPDAQGQGGDEQGAAVDPEEQKAGYRKAIELSPKAVEEMEAVVKSLGAKDRVTSGKHAEEARRILEEIQKSQPKNPQQNKQNDQQDQQQKQDQDQKSDSNEDQKGNQQDEQEQKKEDQSSDKKDDKSGQDQKPGSKQQQAQVSKDRVEDALRKVRERQQEKRERDKKMKAQFLGKGQVDKDW